MTHTKQRYKPLTDQERDEVQRFCHLNIRGIDVGCSDLRRTDNPSVHYMSDWSFVDEFREAGYFRFESAGPSTYGHINIYLVPERCIPFMTQEQLEASVKRFTED